MTPENNSDTEILIYSDFLIDTNQQELSEEIKEDINCPITNDWVYELIYPYNGVGSNNCGYTIGDICFMSYDMPETVGDHSTEHVGIEERLDIEDDFPGGHGSHEIGNPDLVPENLSGFDEEL